MSPEIFEEIKKKLLLLDESTYTNEWALIDECFLEIQKLRTALEFYADESNWKELKFHTSGYFPAHPGYHTQTESHLGWVLSENGDKARKALED